VVEVVRDRVYFLGRKSDVINVGGNKVHPLEVERVIGKAEGVADVRVFGKSSSVAGELVACEIVPEEGRIGEEVKKLVARKCSEELTHFQRPRFITIVSDIRLSMSGKVIRGETQ
jgi:acyl-CoA synthetase (AMP-forming)/AMP-acid ligase II